MITLYSVSIIFLKKCGNIFKKKEKKKRNLKEETTDSRSEGDSGTMNGENREKFALVYNIIR